MVLRNRGAAIARIGIEMVSVGYKERGIYLNALTKGLRRLAKELGRPEPWVVERDIERILGERDD